jgi:V8-like Glu-specific endopeptidase
VIGATTGLTAAHCLYDGVNYRELFSWRPGADGWDEDPTPYDEHACYLPFVPEGSGTLQTINIDFGVADFAEGDCGPRTQPGYPGGTMEPFLFDDAELLDATFHLYGYPGTEVNPQPLELWGHRGSVTDALPEIIQFNIDETGGQSGSPVFYWNGWGSALIAGLTSGGTNDFGRTINRGARITPGVLAFIEVYTSEF